MSRNRHLAQHWNLLFDRQALSFYQCSDESSIGSNQNFNYRCQCHFSHWKDALAQRRTHARTNTGTRVRPVSNGILCMKFVNIGTCPISGTVSSCARLVGHRGSHRIVNVHTSGNNQRPQWLLSSVSGGTLVSWPAHCIITLNDVTSVHSTCLTTRMERVPR